ncbi:MAG: hypothetical protein MRY78_09640 [Saprospiraceae bacterium]|nr:hypothetical protein [Saprospiraceae bacterium]
MRFAFILSLLHFLPLIVQAQYRTEFGLDLITPLIVATGNNVAPSSLEIIYKEDVGDRDLRFKFLIRSGYQDYELIRRVDVDSTQYYNYAVPTRSYGINLGFAPKFTVQGIQLYYGMDLHFSLDEATTIVTTTDCDPLENSPICDQVTSLDNTHYTLGFIPFLGGKLAITDRIVLTIELGTELDFFLGNYNYYIGDGQTRQQRINFFQPQLNRFLNDIALSYRF